MILDVIIQKTDDGCTADIPSLKGCECWAHNEEAALDKIIDLASYYLKTDKKKFKLDKARAGKTRNVYKLVFFKGR